MIFGACANQQAASPSASPSASNENIKIAEIDGQPVYKSELESWLNMMGYGSDVLTDPNYADALQDVLDTFMTVKTMNAEIVKRGYVDKLTSDQLAQAAQNAQTDIDSSVDNYGVTEEQVLNMIGMTIDELIEQYKLKIAGNAAFTELVGDIKPTEEQVRKKYDDTVASQKEKMDADPTVYVTNVNSGTDVYYAPVGVRMVRKLLIPISAETAEAIGMLRDSGYDDQAEVLLKDALAGIQTEADQAVADIGSGLSFSEAMTKYNKDTDAPEGGYPVVKGSADYADAFTEKAMALTTVGQVSEMFSTDEGYQIIEYTSDVTPGTTEYESVKDKINESMLSTVQADAWAAMIEQWETEHNVKTFVENL